jgi:hypothetical protein
MLSPVDSSIFAAAMVVILFCMGSRNRRQGWQRERHDLVADIRELRAEFGSGAQVSQPLKPAVSPGPLLATTQILRLNAALQEFGRGERIDESGQGLPAARARESEGARTSVGAADSAARHQMHGRP